VVMISGIRNSLLSALSRLQPATVFNIRSLQWRSVSRAQAVLSQLSVQLPPSEVPTIDSRTRLTMHITFRHESHRKHRFHCYSPEILLLLYACPLPSDRPGIVVRVYRPLPGNGCCSQRYRLVTGVYVRLTYLGRNML
jgi:hypothetical protein